MASFLDLNVDLQPKQQQFCDLVEAIGPKAPTIIGYGGARGGAKSGACRRVMLSRRFDHPGTPGFIVRRNFRELYENHVTKFQIEYPELTQYYHAGKKEYQLPNSSRIVLLYADTTDEVRRISRGPECMDLFIDQAEQFTAEELTMFGECNRWPGAEPRQCKTALFFNPRGVGIEILQRWFRTRKYLGEERPEDYAFIQAYGWDNYQWFAGEFPISESDFYKLPDDVRFSMFLQTSYGHKLDALPAAQRAGELLGSFESIEGQYFAGVWDESLCVLPKSLVDQIIQPWWQRWMSQDWAFAEHAAHGWFASGKLSPSQWMQYFGGQCDYTMDVVILYREHIISGRAEADLATDIVAMTPQEERKQLTTFVLSQDAFGQRPRQAGAHSVGEQFSRIMQRYSMPSPQPADQERVIGWRWFYNCLRQAGLRGSNIGEERAKQGPAFFVSAECPNAISCIPLAIRDEDEPDDVMRVDGALWEDVTDMCRYGLKFLMPGKSKAPLAVRAQEVYNSIPGETSDAMTARAMVMRQFWDKENTQTRVSRAPRWR
jgi:hypothetical protein